ncbi:hypothetical protein [Parafilimonas terrae]|uniref:hypothetical protein n=1 Tax=Parafilimonas terrae TaxID=1465490 RepID=UPI001160A634|nr:hypothetical protein [Parafilimonas terrae]
MQKGLWRCGIISISAAGVDYSDVSSGLLPVAFFFKCLFDFFEINYINLVFRAVNCYAMAVRADLEGVIIPFLHINHDIKNIVFIKRFPEA